MTTVEQTLLDLADSPGLGDLGKPGIDEAMGALTLRADWDLVRRLAIDQHKPTALAVAARVGGHVDASA